MMKRLVPLFLLALTPGAPLFAQPESFGIEVDADPNYPGQIFKLEWWGNPDVYYVVEVSLDLRTWDRCLYAVKGVDGDDGEGQPEGVRVAPVTGTSQAFFRLAFTSDPNSPLGRADHDNDGIATADELDAGLDPLAVDTDGDGMPDGWEVDGGLSPLDPADAQQDADGDGMSNQLEYVYGRRPDAGLRSDAEDELRLRVITPMEDPGE